MAGRVQRPGRWSRVIIDSILSQRAGREGRQLCVGSVGVRRRPPVARCSVLREGRRESRVRRERTRRRTRSAKCFEYH